ncbi:MAG: DNA polymerase III subunit gamma/tau [Candidatus Sacchiramonaceae bacterium]|nr:DNA polymerase III subunit gamma/tau [Candidatus Saccharimonadaceae bacterium]
MSQAFYRKYRSKKLSEVVGQDHITTVLESAIAKNKIAHAYLLTGPRGVGKTSVARILAHEINKIPYKDESYHPDIIEIDAASNNGVDDIRSLRDQVQVAPFSANKRIYIIDEVHMLSKQAFNALLKTLEEPPEHVVFILATTDPHKLPPTIISRTQQFVFHYISREDIIKHLRFIADSEKLKINDEALSLIAERGSGSFRDSISLLDQISSMNSKDEITPEFLESILGLTPQKNIRQLISEYEAQNVSEIIKIIEETKKSGLNLQTFVDQFITEIRRNLAAKPHLITLLSPLIEVKNSPFVDIELLCILIKTRKKNIASAVATKPDFIEAPAPTLHVPQNNFEPLEKTAAVKPAQPAKKTVPKPIAKPISPKEDSKDSEREIEMPSGEAKPFEWSAFLGQMKELNMPAFSILNSISYEIEGDKIKLYTGRAIYKKKLDTAKYRGLMGEVLKKLNAGGWTFETYAEQKPLSDETAAAIVGIMGGGEEVKIDE